MATAAIAGHLSDSLVGHPHCSITTTTKSLITFFLSKIFIGNEKNPFTKYLINVKNAKVLSYHFL